MSLTQPPQSQLVAGTITTDYPEVGGLESVAKFHRTQGNRPFCTGTLVGPHTFVTAAHCLSDPYSNEPPETPETILVRLRDQLYVVRSISLPPGYDGSTADIAVVTLMNDVVIPPAQLARTNAYVGRTAVAVGYGETDDPSDPNGRPGHFKRVGNVTVARCPRYSDMFIEHGSVCWHANLGDTTSEIGDSGGPVLIESKTGQRILVGVITGGDCANSEDTCTQGWNFSTPVAKYRSWIRARAKLE